MKDGSYKFFCRMVRNSHFRGFFSFNSDIFRFFSTDFSFTVTSVWSALLFCCFISLFRCFISLFRCFISLFLGFISLFLGLFSFSILSVTSVSIIFNPTDGTVSVDPVTGDVTYTPNANFYGTDSYVYEICDDGHPLPTECDQATVTIDVEPVNDEDIDIVCFI